MPAIKSFGKKERQQALKMLREGKTNAEVAAVFGVKRDTIYRFKKRMDFVGPAVKSPTKVISFRLSQDEHRAFLALAQECGSKNTGAFVRSLVRSSAGFLEISREKADALDELRVALNKIGTNINQIAWAANARKIDLVKSEWAEIQSLRTDIAALRTYLNTVVAEARRRGSRLWRKSEYGHE